MFYFAEFPVGIGETYIGKRLDEIELNTELGYFCKKGSNFRLVGLIQCAIVAEKDLYLPMLV